MTWNILSDLYDKRLTNMQKRIDNIVVTLLEADPTLICLQEVNDDVFNALESAFKTKYNIIRTELKVNNVVLLSKIPFANFSVIHFNRDKEALHAQLANGYHVVGVHLTSNKQGNFASRRTLQLNQVMQELIISTDALSRPVIILGDFNTSDPLPVLDSFSECVLNEFTYNVNTNRYAKALSQAQRNEKLDRLFYKSGDLPEGNGQILINRHTVMTNIEYSDHYPVLFHVDVVEGAANPSSSNVVVPQSKSALSIVIPFKFWKQLGYVKPCKWMPHLNMLFPFFENPSEEQKHRLHELLQPYLAANLDITVEGCDFFEQPGSCTVYAKLDIASTVLLRRLYHEITVALGVYGDASAFTPHITVARVEDRNEAQRLLRLYHTLRFSFKLKRLCHVCNLNNSFYEIVDIYGTQFDGSMQSLLEGFGFEVQLGGSALLAKESELEVTSDASSHPKLAATAGSGIGLESICNLNHFSAMHDHDFVVLGNMPRNEFMTQYLRILKTMGLFTRVEHIQNAFVEYLKVCVHHGSHMFSFDIHYAPKSWKTSIATLTPLDCRSLAVFRSSQFIIDLHLPGYYSKLTIIKAFARQCGVYGMRHGYLSGISWAVLVAHCMIYYHGNEQIDWKLCCDSEFVNVFCDYYSAFDFKYKVVLPEIAQHIFNVGPGCRLSYLYSNHHDEMNQMFVASPLNHHENTVRNMTESSCAFIQRVIRSRFNHDIVFANLIATTVYVQCENYAVLDMFSTSFDANYLRLIRKFERAGMMGVVGDNVVNVDRLAYTMSCAFYYPQPLIGVNTVWCWLLDHAQTVFGSQVYIQIR